VITVLPVTHMFIHYLYSQLYSITALWPVLVSHPAEGKRLSWPGWLVAHRRGLPARSGHLSEY